MSAAEAYVVVDGVPAESVGALVFWELSGRVDFLDLKEALEAEGLGDLAPKPPSAETVLIRAAEAVIRPEQRAGRRLMVRPLGRRQAWDVVEESVEHDADKKDDELRYRDRVRITAGKNGDAPTAMPRGVSDLSYSADDAVLAARIRAEAPRHEGVLTANDYSSWLLGLLQTHVRAVGLRDRGGFYFVPRDMVEAWRKLVAVTRAVSGHRMHEIPALHSDEAVEAVLSGVHREAEAQFARLEGYLAGGEWSTRGLNAVERDLAAAQDKVRKYADLLGVALPDLEQKAIQLGGALVVARVKREQSDGG